MPTAILELIAIGAKIFSDERQEYFKSRSKKLMEKIQSVEDSDFYHKDMEAKGMAERQLMLDTEALRKEYIIEATK
jgi:hypothetical protein